MAPSETGIPLGGPITKRHDKGGAEGEALRDPLFRRGWAAKLPIPSKQQVR